MRWSTASTSWLPEILPVTIATNLRSRAVMRRIGMTAVSASPCSSTLAMYMLANRWLLIAIHLGALMRQDRVLNDQRVQTELLHNDLQLRLGWLVQVQPHHLSGCPARRSLSPRPGNPRPRQLTRGVAI